MNLDIQLQKSSLAFDKVSELDQMGILYQTESPQYRTKQKQDKRIQDKRTS